MTHVYEFGGFRLDPRRRVLARADGAPIVLKPKVFDALLYLVEHAGQPLDKSAMMAAIWPNLVVEENNLNKTISVLRRTLGETPDDHRYIVTDPGRGYRFVATVARREPVARRPGCSDRTRHGGRIRNVISVLVGRREPDRLSESQRPRARQRRRRPRQYDRRRDDAVPPGRVGRRRHDPIRDRKSDSSRARSGGRIERCQHARYGRRRGHPFVSAFLARRKALPLQGDERQLAKGCHLCWLTRSERARGAAARGLARDLCRAR